MVTARKTALPDRIGLMMLILISAACVPTRTTTLFSSSQRWAPCAGRSNSRYPYEPMLHESGDWRCAVAHRGFSSNATGNRLAEFYSAARGYYTDPKVEPRT